MNKRPSIHFDFGIITRVTAAACLAVFLSTPASAAVITKSATAPTVDGADIAQLNSAGSYDIGGNQGHIWSNRPAQGQSFMTGSNPGGYTLNAITFQTRQAVNHNSIFQTRVGTISGTAFTQTYTEDFTKIGFSANDYITTTFTTPQSLSPDTLYGWDWGTDGSGFITNNNADTNYAGGSAYSSDGPGGFGGASITLHNGAGGGTGDRVFHLDIAAVEAETVPEPASIAIWTLLGLGCFGYYRARRKK